MTDCANVEVRELLPELVAGTLAGSARDGVEAHLATCAACREEAALLGSARALLHREAPAVDVERIAAVAANGRPVRRTRLLALAAAAAGVIATGAVALVLALGSGEGEGEGVVATDDPVRAADRVEAGALTLAMVVPHGGRLEELDEAALRDVLAALDDLELLPETEPVSLGLWPAEPEGS